LLFLPLCSSFFRVFRVFRGSTLLHFELTVDGDWSKKSRGKVPAFKLELCVCLGSWKQGEGGWCLVPSVRAECYMFERDPPTSSDSRNSCPHIHFTSREEAASNKPLASVRS